MLDNGYISEAAKYNCQMICDITDTELITIRLPQPRMKSYYRKALQDDIPVDTFFLQRASSLCNGCIKMVNESKALSMANKFGYRIIAGGYIEIKYPQGTIILNYHQNFFLIV